MCSIVISVKISNPTKPAWNPIPSLLGDMWTKESPETECIICMESMNFKNQPIYALQCKHSFHKKVIVQINCFLVLYCGMKIIYYFSVSKIGLKRINLVPRVGCIAPSMKTFLLYLRKMLVDSKIYYKIYKTFVGSDSDPFYMQENYFVIAIFVQIRITLLPLT